MALYIATWGKIISITPLSAALGWTNENGVCAEEDGVMDGTDAPEKT